MAKSDDSGNLSIDFLAGFTIFIIAFIWVVSMVPGLLINLQAFTIDYDAVAYRTSVILVEDPGASKYNTSSWEVVRRGDDYDPSMVTRFGLAVSREAPNILSLDKVNRFFDTGTFDADDYYLSKAIFGDYPYKFNISLRYIDTSERLFVGNPVPDGSYGYIRRFVKVKEMSNMTIDGSDYDLLKGEKYINGDNRTRVHFVSILLDNNNLTGKASPVKNPSFQVIPAQESVMINLTYLNYTMRKWSDDTIPMEDCYDIMVNDQSITIGDGSPPLQYLRNVTIDENPVWLKNAFTKVEHNLSILLDTTVDMDRRDIDFDSDQVTVDMKFTLVANPITNEGCPCPVLGASKDEIACSGALFLNSSSKTSLTGHHFFYDYTTDRVTIPPLRDAMFEVAVW